MMIKFKTSPCPKLIFQGTGVKIIKIDTLYTEGKDINDLISVQFVRKVVELVKSKDYTMETE